MSESLQAEDVRAARPYYLSASPLKTLVRRVASIAILAFIDISGLTIGLYGALALRAYFFDPQTGLAIDGDSDRFSLASAAPAGRAS